MSLPPDASMRLYARLLGLEQALKDIVDSVRHDRSESSLFVDAEDIRARLAKVRQKLSLRFAEPCPICGSETETHEPICAVQVMEAGR